MTDDNDIWARFKETVTPKKTSPEFEGLALQKKLKSPFKSAPLCPLT